VHLVVWLNDVRPGDLAAVIARAGGRRRPLLCGALSYESTAARRPALRLRLPDGGQHPRRDPPSGGCRLAPSRTSLVERTASGNSGGFFEPERDRHNVGLRVHQTIEIVVRLAGVEPATLGLEVRRSIPWKVQGSWMLTFLSCPHRRARPTNARVLLMSVGASRSHHRRSDLQREPGSTATDQDERKEREPES